MSSQAESRGPQWWAAALVGVERVGLGSDEVAAVARDQGLSELPGAYDGFLRSAGRRCGDLWLGSAAFYPDILGLRLAATDLLEEANAALRLAPTDIVVAMHQGYEFIYLSGPGEDPPVRVYSEGDVVSRELGPQFSSFVLAALAGVES